jgi:Protein of unknown function (DUF4232)
MTLRAHLRRTSLTGATLVVVAVFTAGCNSSSSSSSAAVGASASGSASGSAAGATGAPSAPAASAPAAAGTGASSVAACTTPDLKGSTGSGGGGTPGSYYSFIDLTNTSATSCTLYGYPGVSLTSASGAQIGAAATRSTTPAAQLVTLAPGATANAELRMTDPTVYPTSQCQQTTPAYLKIYPPDQTQPVQVPFTGTTCANSSIKMLAISVVTPGTQPAS